MATIVPADPLAPFSPAVRAWFEASFEAPTDAQARGWEAIARGEHTLIHAPTGSGKTLAAFLYALDHLARDPSPPPTRQEPGHVRVLYVSPLKALNNDIHRNLQLPLAGVAETARRMGTPLPIIEAAVRTGDTSTQERQRLVRKPPHVLITTPESLHLLLTSRARDTLRGVRHVIIDAIESPPARLELLTRAATATYLTVPLGLAETLPAQQTLTRLRSHGARVLGCIAAQANNS